MLSWLYPDTCELCGEWSDTTLCPTCREGLVRVPRPLCLHCGTPTWGKAHEAQCCEACESLPAGGFDFARSALLRDENNMSLIYALKYRRANHLARALAPLLAEQWKQTPELRAHDDWVLVPVPVERGRLFRRGYNQAEELALALRRILGFRVWQPLHRLPTAYASQTRLSARARMLNARKAYTLKRSVERRPDSVSPHLLLIDDVYTTGATVSACAAVLRRLNGVSCIGVLTLLRAVRG